MWNTEKAEEIQASRPFAGVGQMNCCNTAPSIGKAVMPMGNTISESLATLDRCTSTVMSKAIAIHSTVTSNGEPSTELPTITGSLEAQLRELISRLDYAISKLDSTQQVLG